MEIELSDRFFFTVQTCTYNRSSTLRRTYKSLARQTFKDFEWIVYDNGSTDNTSELVKQWQAEADFPIVLLRREDNAAIQLSWNIVINQARGKFWTLLDSDDECIPTALEVFKQKWDSIPEAEQSKYVGVTCNCIDQHGELVGKQFPSDPMDSNPLDVVYKEKISGEKWGVMRLDVMKKYPFPTSSHHVLPGVVWRAIARDYKTRFFNECLRIYYIDDGPRKDQMSFHQKLSVISKGKRENSQDLLNNYFEWMLSSPAELMRNVVVYNQMSSALKYSLKDRLANINKPLAKLLVLGTWPVANFSNLVPPRMVRSINKMMSA